MIKLKCYASKTHQGPFLNINEDGYEIDLVNELFLVLDGYGGAGIGDKVVNELKENIRTFYTKVVVDPESTLPFYFSPKFLIEGNALLNSMLFTHKNLYKKNSILPLSKRGGASAVAASKTESLITFFGTGSSMAYLYRNGTIVRIISDDSTSILHTENLEGYKYATPLSGFGLFEDFHFTSKEIKIFEDDLFILLTDGLYSRIRSIEIKSIIERSKHNLSQMVDKMIELSNSRGNLDNQTIIILQY